MFTDSLVQDVRYACRGARRSPREAPVLILQAPPGLAAKWLVPRLQRFAEADHQADVGVLRDELGERFARVIRGDGRGFL